MEFKPAVYVAILSGAVLATASQSIAQEKPAGQPNFMEMIEQHWDQFPQRTMGNLGDESYSGDVPVCGNPIVGNCVVNANTLWINNRFVRLARVDAPHPKGKCEAERRLADRGIRRLSALLSSRPYTIEADFGQTGNTVAMVTLGKDVAGDVLIREGLARESRSGNSQWCEELEDTGNGDDEATLEVRQMAIVSAVFNAARKCGFTVDFARATQIMLAERELDPVKRRQVQSLRRDLFAQTNVTCAEWREHAVKEGVLAKDGAADGAQQLPRAETRGGSGNGPAQVRAMPVCSLLVGDCVVDANTLRIDGRTIRLAGIQVPKPDGSCVAERQLGKLAANRLSALLSGQPYTIAGGTADANGVLTARVSLASGDAGRMLVDEGLANSADQQVTWCASKEQSNAMQESEQKPPSWGDRFNPDGEVPETGFNAVYFDRHAIFFPNIQRIHTDKVMIRFQKRRKFGISARDFGGYWVGKLKFDAPTRKIFSITEHGSTKIRINGEIIHDSARDKGAISHDFTAGEHVMEVEYANGWHTLDFKLTVHDEERRITRSELAQEIGQMRLDDAHLYYAGLYRSSSDDFTVRLDLPESDHPVVLWLDSHLAVDWVVPDDRQVALVVIASRDSGSSVEGAGVERVVRVDDNIGIRNYQRKCVCRNNRFHCDHKKDLMDAADMLTQITGLTLQRYELVYRTDRVTLVPYDQLTMADLLDIRAEEKRLEPTCRKQVRNRG